MSGPDRAGLPGALMIVGGLALAALTFVAWYQLDGINMNAWEALRRTDVLVFAGAVVIALCGAWLAFGDVGPERRFVAALGAAAAAAAALIVIVRIVSPPGELEVKAGIFLALAAAVLGGVGALMALSGAQPRGQPPGEA